VLGEDAFEFSVDVSAQASEAGDHAEWRHIEIGSGATPVGDQAVHRI
jgi:hypothetical protein